MNNTHVILSEHATTARTALARWLIGDRALPCRLLSSDSPYYLAVELHLPNDEQVHGPVLIRHQDVDLVVTDAPGIALGFAQAAPGSPGP